MSEQPKKISLNQPVVEDHAAKVMREKIGDPRSLSRPAEKAFGATIELASPSADPLGRVGIKGKVNSHFLERFGSALLQSTLNLGVGVATSRIAGNNSSVLLALPNSVGSSTGSSLSDSQQFQRTLRVKQGVSVSVFVAKDLDFTAVETKR